MSASALARSTAGLAASAVGAGCWAHPARRTAAASVRKIFIGLLCCLEKYRGVSGLQFPVSGFQYGDGVVLGWWVGAGGRTDTQPRGVGCLVYFTALIHSRTCLATFSADGGS